VQNWYRIIWPFPLRPNQSWSRGIFSRSRSSKTAHKIKLNPKAVWPSLEQEEDRVII